MRLASITRAVNLRLARDLPSAAPGAMPLLRQGAILSPRFIEAVAAQGIHAVWVEDALSEGITPVELMPEEVRSETATRVHGALRHAQTALASGQPLPIEVLDDIASIAQRIAASISDSPPAALALSDLASADQYTHRHSVNVTALGLLLGRTLYRRHGWLDYRGKRRFDGIESRLALLGMGLLLHDIGKMAIPSSILNKDGPLDAAEWALMRTHPDAGVALLDFSAISPLVKSVVRDHHERWDGSGYPRGLAGDRISHFARIAAVADVYDAVVSARPYKSAAPPHVGVSVITDGAGQIFGEDVVDAFRAVVMPYPVGTEVVVPDGRRGVVAEVDPGDPHAPVVRMEGTGGPTSERVDMRAPVLA